MSIVLKINPLYEGHSIASRIEKLIGNQKFTASSLPKNKVVASNCRVRGENCSPINPTRIKWSINPFYDWSLSVPSENFRKPEVPDVFRRYRKSPLA